MSILIEDIYAMDPEPEEDTMTFELKIEEMVYISHALGFYWLHREGLVERRREYIKSMSIGFLEASQALQALTDARLRRYGEK